MINNQDWTSPPVFICGFPKSGTTLLLALLDNHPELLVFPEETHFFNKISGYPERLQLDYIFNHTSIKTLGLGRVQITSGFRDYSNIDYSRYKKVLAEIWDIGPKSERKLLESIIYSFGKVTNKLVTKYWVEKTPLNEKHLKKGVDWWPDLRAIYIIRDPRDNFCSYRTHRAKQVKSRKARLDSENMLSRSEKRKRTLKLPRPLTALGFIAGWIESIKVWRVFSRDHPNTLLIRYEDLVQSPTVVMEQVCEFLEIEWDDTLLRPTRNGHPWTGNSMYGTEFTGISTDSVGRYKLLLSDDEKCLIQSWLSNYFRQFGWQLDGNNLKSGTLLRELVFSRETKLTTKLRLLLVYLKLFVPVVD